MTNHKHRRCRRPDHNDMFIKPCSVDNQFPPTRVRGRGHFPRHQALREGWAESRAEMMISLYYENAQEKSSRHPVRASDSGEKPITRWSSENSGTPGGRIDNRFVQPRTDRHVGSRGVPCDGRRSLHPLHRLRRTHRAAQLARRSRRSLPTAVGIPSPTGGNKPEQSK
jgi:hypothetical protein